MSEKLQEKKADSSWDLLRLVAYVCMTPRDKATPEVLERRKGAVQKNVSTTHWPHQFSSRGSSPDLIVSNAPYLQKDLI